jgi:hypothetical protein
VGRAAELAQAKPAVSAAPTPFSSLPSPPLPIASDEFAREYLKRVDPKIPEPEPLPSEKE